MVDLDLVKVLCDLGDDCLQRALCVPVGSPSGHVVDLLLGEIGGRSEHRLAVAIAAGDHIVDGLAEYGCRFLA